MDIHAQHWANEEDELYYVLRTEIVKGMFEPAGLSYDEPQEGTYEIRAQFKRIQKGTQDQSVATNMGYTRLELSF